MAVIAVNSHTIGARKSRLVLELCWELLWVCNRVREIVLCRNSFCACYVPLRSANCTLWLAIWWQMDSFSYISDQPHFSHRILLKNLIWLESLAAVICYIPRTVHLFGPSIEFPWDEWTTPWHWVESVSLRVRHLNTTTAWNPSQRLPTTWL